MNQELSQPVQLITHNRVSEAIHLLRESITDAFQKDQLIVLEAMWNRTISQEINRIISIENANLQKNQVINALLTLIHNEQYQSYEINELRQGAVLKLDTTFHDFKKVKKSNKRYKRIKFSITNIGEKELRINDISSNSKNIQTLMLNRQIAPGGSAELIVDFYPKETGEQLEIITIEANTEPSQTAVSISAVVENKPPYKIITLGVLLFLLIGYGANWLFTRPIVSDFELGIKVLRNEEVQRGHSFDPFKVKVVGTLDSFEFEINSEEELGSASLKKFIGNTTKKLGSIVALEFENLGVKPNVDDLAVEFIELREKNSGKSSGRIKPPLGKEWIGDGDGNDQKLMIQRYSVKNWN